MLINRASRLYDFTTAKFDLVLTRRSMTPFPDTLVSSVQHQHYSLQKDHEADGWSVHPYSERSTKGYQTFSFGGNLTFVKLFDIKFLFHFPIAAQQ